MPIEQALTLHGPLKPTSASSAKRDFIVIAAQLPTCGDIWLSHADDILEIVRQVKGQYSVDPAKCFLTGFSYGGNGVFDLAQQQRDVWAALWPVDPTRLPTEKLTQPIWLSSGEFSRHYEQIFVERFHLKKLNGAAPTDRVYVDEGSDHVGTATLAYEDERIYRWLLSNKLPGVEGVSQQSS